MRTNIDLDDELVERARRLTGAKTKKAVVEEGLRTLIRLKEQEKVRGLFGKLHWEGDLASLREGRGEPDSRSFDRLDRSLQRTPDANGGTVSRLSGLA